MSPELSPEHFIGRRASVHWNLHREAYSIKVTGAPVFLVPAVRMEFVTFHIDARLRALFEKHPNRRTVHALVRGFITGYHTTSIGGEMVDCNPFRWSSFVRSHDEAPVATASLVVLHADRRIEAVGLELAESLAESA